MYPNRNEPPNPFAVFLGCGLVVFVVGGWLSILIAFIVACRLRH